MKKYIRRFFISSGILALLYVLYFFVVHRLDRSVLQAPAEKKTGLDNDRRLLSSLFINGERFYLRLRSVKGDTLLAYCDSGGGICMMPGRKAKDLGYSGSCQNGIIKALKPFSYLKFEELIDDRSAPEPVIPRHLVIRTPFAQVSEPFFLVPPDDDDETRFIMVSMDFDLFLGQHYFMGKSWTFDYPRREIWINTPLSTADLNDATVMKLGFKKNEADAPIFGHPGMKIIVEGDTLDVLFDTGATIVLSEAGKNAFGTREKTIGGSFIAASVFDKWKKDYPEWKIYENVDVNRDVIEVPLVRIGGIDVGPVIFAKRPDEVWSEGMIHSMDRVVKGAIGGSALKYLKVTIDYNSELIRFEKP